MTNTEPDTYAPPPHGWTCFHCGDHFPCNRQGQEAAEEHFGPTPDVKPACIERQTTTWPEIMKRYRKALKKTERWWRRVQQAEEDAEVAHIRAAAWKDAFKGCDTALDAFHRVEDLRLQVQDHGALMRELHRVAPDVFQAVHVALAGPGEYFPPSSPTTENQPCK